MKSASATNKKVSSSKTTTAKPSIGKARRSSKQAISPSSSAQSAPHDPLARKQQAWSARFQEAVSERVQRYTASVGFDYRLALHDIRGSLAHAGMLAEQGIISRQDLRAIQKGLSQIQDDIAEGQFDWQLALEDVHLNIEARLTALIGDAGKRLHTGRSRNDQVATDIRLYLRESVDALVKLLAELVHTLASQAEQYHATVMPGFTHLQVAQPITFGHHLLAYVEMFERDIERLLDARHRINRLPLGAAALAGTSYPIDRDHVAKALDFEQVSRNSLDAVSDRDFAIEFCAAASIIMMHISRLSEELILWMNPQWGFVTLPDRFCTGSSIMPQKKNPDVPELARGKTGRVYGHLMALLTLMKSQPLAYNKDNQEDKEPLFDTVDTLTDTLIIFQDMMAGIHVHPEPMRQALLKGYATATDLADALVKRGIAFRDAHEAVAAAVQACEQRACALEDLSHDELAAALRPALAHLPEASRLLKEDFSKALTLEASLAARQHTGGTAPSRVKAAAKQAIKRCQRYR